MALLLSLLTGALFAQLEQLMTQVESGNFKAVDFDNFDSSSDQAQQGVMVFGLDRIQSVSVFDSLDQILSLTG